MASTSKSSRSICEALSSTIQSVTRLIPVIEASWQQTSNLGVRWALRELRQVLVVLIRLECSLQEQVSGRRLAAVHLLHAGNGPIQQFQHLLGGLQRRVRNAEIFDDAVVESIRAVERFKWLFQRALQGSTVDEPLCPDESHGTRSSSPSLPSRDCRLCYNLGDGESRYNRTPLKALAASSSNGCEGCTVLDTILQPYRNTHERFILGLGHKEADVVMQLSLDDLQLEVCISPDSPCPWGGIAIRRPISGDTGSSLAVNQVHEWIQTCLREHGDGCAPAIAKPLPARIIQIQGPQSVILQTDTRGIEDLYLCLSHCWGNTHVFQSTSTNIAEHEQEIPWNSLPRTFQDAVSFTYSLGFRYIWIDSLCILQDDVEDWRKQGSQMDLIYANSVLTLAASLGADSNAGCFRKTQHAKTWMLWSEQWQEQYVIHVRGVLGHHKDISAYCGVVEHLPLLERGWTLQERLLSPRVVHFGNEELWWECSGSITCECGEGITDDRYETSIPPTKRDILNLPDYSETPPWNIVVEEYTCQRLSFQSDIFPALQGLAKRMQGSTKPRYLAGLWEDTLVFGLMWKATIHHERPNKWRAPSWSWAAVVGSVWMYKKSWRRPADSVHAVAEVLYVETVPRGRDPFGELQCGLLEIKGRAISAQLTVSNSKALEVDDPEDIPLRHYRLHIPGSSTGEAFEFGLNAGERQPRWNSVVYYADFKWWVDQSTRPPETTVYITRMVDEEEAIGTLRRLYLVLNCIDEELLLYERIGIIEYAELSFKYPWYNEELENLLGFQRAFERAEEELTFMIV